MSRQSWFVRVVALVLGASGGLATASPCTASASYVRSPEAARAPLLRPYLIGGMATTALHLRDKQRWLELAVNDAATAQRLLAGRTAPPMLAEVGGAVLLACDGLEAGDGRQAAAPLAAPLW